MTKVNLFVCVMSGLGFVLSVIALILLLVSNNPFFSEHSIDAWILHPLVWAIISGTVFFPMLFQLLKDT